MSAKLTRRAMLQAAGAVAVAPEAGTSQTIPGLRAEGKDTPKLCLQVGSPVYSPGGFDAAGMRRIKQLGVDYTLTGDGPRGVWEERQLRELKDGLQAGGLTLYHMYLSPGFPNATFGRPGRDEEIEKVIQSIRAAGQAGIPVLEYNWYAHRAAEGYYEETGRAGSGVTSFDYDRVKDLPPLPGQRVTRWTRCGATSPTS